MSKKKKKTVPLTARQKLKKKYDAAVRSAAGTAARLRIRADAAFTALCGKTEVFLRCRGSAAAVTVVFLLLMTFTYLLFGHRYLTSEFTLTFPFAIPLYLIDFKVGFVSRALVGQVVALFTDTLSLNQIFAIARISAVTVWAVEAAMAAAAFKKAFLNRTPLICMLCLIFVLSPVTVMSNLLYLGFLDPFNLLLTAFYFYIADTKAARFLTPLVCVTGIVLHYQFVLAFLPVILTLELYYICKDKKGRGLRIASLCVTLISSAAVAVYLVFFSRLNVKMDADALYDYMCGKFTDYRSWGLFKDYFTYYIYGEYDGVNYSAPADFVRYLLQVSFKGLNWPSMLGYAAALVPIYGLMEYFWVCLFNKAEKGMKLPYLVFMLQPLVLVVSMIASTDNARWAGASIFSNSALLFTVCRDDAPGLREAANRLKRRPVLLVIAAVLLAGYVISLVTMKKQLT